eukprot:CAMPEP_0194576216 /NCGR_PEP_ID=MMETSP0292-20121207/11409_1 /TAXON_ID=39354 /ORGANISM="Heterosigma akashiwo, Strain CCMP2393" /LENGTH=65 /DNA_ID=CAMNT_0039428199 /DNA_START=22 /DNA_END=219 /DNA_ORIENTATION=+
MPPNLSGPVVTLGIVSAATIGAIAYAHFSSKWEKEEMHKGVIRDIERQRQKKKTLQKEVKDEMKT